MLAAEGFGFGLVVSSYLFGLRHGIDWDHLAAIADITSSQDDRKQSLWFGTLYALGHGAVVFALGVLAIVAGGFIPSSLETFMTKVVGVTLLVLGVYVFVSLVRHGRDFRLRSRWMLIFAGIRKGTKWARRRVRVGAEGDDREAFGGEQPPGAPGESPSAWHHGHHGRRGHHHHVRPEHDDDIPAYGTRTAFGVGMIHGIGAETPTQVLIFLAAAGAGGAAVGIFVLIVFILGLLTTNSLITAASTLGYLSAVKNFTIYAIVALLTATFSLIIGVLFLLGREGLLPAFFGG